MNFYAIVNGVNSILTFVVLLVIIFNRSKKIIPRTYAFWSLLLFLWTFSYFIWGIQTDKENAAFWLKNVLYFCCVIHMSYFSFALAFSDKLKSYKKHLIVGYILSFVFVVINFFDGFIDASHLRQRGPFPFWPLPSKLLPLLIITETYFVILSFIILNRAANKSDLHLKNRRKMFLYSATIAWTGGLMNWLPFYDLPAASTTFMPPIGNIGVTFYVVVTYYLIFKHDLLQLNLAIKRTFIYACLTLFITLSYISFIILFEKISQSFFGYKSIFGTLLASLFIALLFNPLRHAFTAFVNKRFFGNDLIELSNENMQMRNALIKQDQLKAVATLAAGMAHEIKNPLTSLRTFAEYLPVKYDDPDFRQNFSRIVIDEVDRINNTVYQLLEFSKPSEPQLKTVLIWEAVDQTLNLLSSNFLKLKIELTRDYDKSALVQADKNQLKQAFLNIFLNSIQSMKEVGRLTVTVKKDTDKVIVVISDTGCGMTKEQLKHIFDPFYTTKEQGTGLGLAITQGILKKHGCKIHATSQINVGTTFELTFNGNQ